jgi:hypothetical protein
MLTQQLSSALEADEIVIPIHKYAYKFALVACLDCKCTKAGSWNQREYECSWLVSYHEPNLLLIVLPVPLTSVEIHEELRKLNDTSTPSGTPACLLVFDPAQPHCLDCV